MDKKNMKTLEIFFAKWLVKIFFRSANSSVFVFAIYIIVHILYNSVSVYCIIRLTVVVPQQDGRLWGVVGMASRSCIGSKAKFSCTCSYNCNGKILVETGPWATQTIIWYLVLFIRSTRTSLKWAPPWCCQTRSPCPPSQRWCWHHCCHPRMSGYK